MLIYVIGAAIRRLDFVGHYQQIKTLGLWTISVVCIYIWHLFLPKTGYNYCNPLVILEAATLFLMIARLNLRNKNGQLYCPAAFTCYLIHTSVLKVVGKYIAARSSGWRLMLMLFTMVIGVYMLSIVMMKVW